MRVQLRNFDVVIQTRRIKETGKAELQVFAETFDGQRLGGMIFEVQAEPATTIDPPALPLAAKKKKKKGKKSK